MKLAKDQIAQQFGRAAETYDDASQLQMEMADRLIERIPADAAGQLVDLGCGTGWALDQISKLKRFQLTGLDIAREMIKVAQARVSSAEFICADLENTPLNDDCADVVFSNAALQWCESPKAFEEINRIIRPGGLVLASTFGPSTLRQWRSAWQAIDQDSPRVHEFESPSALTLAMNRFGFQDIEVVSIDRELEYASVHTMFQSIKRLGATNATENRQRGLLGRQRYEQVVALFEAELQQAGKLMLTFECIFISARKS